MNAAVPNLEFEFPVVGILLRISAYNVRQFLENHREDFGNAIIGPINNATIENGAQNIRDIIIDASPLLFSVENSPNDRSIRMYVPLDEYYLAFLLIEEVDHCYRIETCDRKYYDHFLYGTWVQYGTQEVVNYEPWMTGVYTRGTAEKNRHYGNIRGPALLRELSIAGIRVQLWKHVIRRHILKKHGREFGCEINGPIDDATIESMYQYIQGSISDNSALFFSIEYSRDDTSILLYVPLDEYYLVVPLERKNDDCYRIKTCYKRENDFFFEGSWVQYGTQAVVLYVPGLMGVYTRGRAEENNHYYNIHTPIQH